MSLNEEKKLWKKGFVVAGLDEAGRGPLAGPVVAAATILSNYKILISNKFLISNVKDSKQLTAKRREEIYNIIKKDSSITYGVGIVSQKVIDQINILEATKLAMKIALKDLQVNYLILDGNFKIDLDIPQKSKIKGDEKVMSCALASIIAKVERDKIMEKYHKKYPEYGFLKHKGYGTKFHYQMIQEHGPSVIHRKSFNLHWIKV